MNKLWSYSLHCEAPFTEVGLRDETINEAREVARTAKSDVFYIAPVIHPELDKIVEIDSESILEKIDEDNFDLMPDSDWPWLCKVKKNHIEELNSEIKKVVIGWMIRNKYEPNWFNVGKIEEIVLEGKE